MEQLTSSWFAVYTKPRQEHVALLNLEQQNQKEGFFLNPGTWGTYIHGIFDNAPVTEYILKQVDHNCRVSMNYKDLKESNYDKLAALLRENSDIDYIYSTLA